MDGVGPVAVEPMEHEAEGGELLIGDGAALRIRSPIQLAPDPQASGRPSGADETDDHGQTHQRLSPRSEEHTSELQSLMRISYAVFCLKKKTKPCQRLTHDTSNDSQHRKRDRP